MLSQSTPSSQRKNGSETDWSHFDGLATASAFLPVSSFPPLRAWRALRETFLPYLLRPNALRFAAGGEVVLGRVDQLLLFTIR